MPTITSFMNDKPVFPDHRPFPFAYLYDLGEDVCRALLPLAARGLVSIHAAPGFSPEEIERTYLTRLRFLDDKWVTGLILAGYRPALMYTRSKLIIRAPQDRVVRPDCTIRLMGLTWLVPEFSPGERVTCFPSASLERLRIQSAHEPQRSTWASPLPFHNPRRNDHEPDKPTNSGNPPKDDGRSQWRSFSGLGLSGSIRIDTTLPGNLRNRIRGKGGAARRAEPTSIRVGVEFRFPLDYGNPDSNKPGAA